MEKTEMYKAPDISVHNGNVNFKSVRDAGYGQAFLRAGYGKNNIDQRYVANAEACRNLGIPVMIYWFSYALTVEMAEKEAEYAIAQAAKYWERCPIAFDLEYDTVRYAATRGVNINKALATDMAIAFLKKVEEKGYAPVLYFNRDYQLKYFDLNKISHSIPEVKHWYARYTSVLSSTELENADVWQYTSTGRISGVSGNVDLNKVYYDLFAGAEVKESEAESKACNLYIKSFQAACNKDGYKDAKGRELDEDGRDGTNTQYVRKKIALKTKQAGSSWNVGSTGALVEWWQRRLNDVLGADLEVDGKFGKDTRAATLMFQKKYGLAPDGIAGYNSIQAVFYN